MDRSTMGRWRRWSAWNCGSRARLRCSRRIWSCSPTTSLRPLAEVVHRARSGQVAQIAPNVARPAVLIGRVTSAGQVAVRAVWSTVKSSMVNPPVTGRPDQADADPATRDRSQEFPRAVGGVGQDLHVGVIGDGGVCGEELDPAGGVAVLGAGSHRQGCGGDQAGVGLDGDVGLEPVLLLLPGLVSV